MTDNAPLSNNRTAPGDRELVDRIRAGDYELFELVMRRYNRRLFLTARSILRSDSDAEDAVQDAYVRGWQRLDEFRGPSGLGAWFTRIVTNEALMRLRRQRGVVSIDVSQMLDTLVDDEPAPEDRTNTMQLRTMLEQAIDKLPQPFRTTYMLREVEQLSIDETAACLDVDPATVKTRIHRARKLLRRDLERVASAAVSEVFPFAGVRCDRIVQRVMERIPASTGL
ncbi:MAG: RNA polymerase sigma factor [Gammaproteobacteria bacterium]